MRVLLITISIFVLCGCTKFQSVKSQTSNFSILLPENQVNELEIPQAEPLPQDECASLVAAKEKPGAFLRILKSALSIFKIEKAHAIITRHDIPDADYIVADGDYPALVGLFGPNDCIATLVQNDFLITVAHCAVEVTVGSNLTIGGSVVAVDQVLLHPEWNDDEDENDIALIHLATPVNNVTPIPLYTLQDEMGKIISIVGRGVYATGLEGEAGAVEDPNMRRVTNQISAVDNMFLEVTFESPDDPAVTALEGVGAAGDSGSPGFIDVNGVAHIAGLNSWGDGEDTGVGVGEYTAKDYQTRVSQYTDWLRASGVCIPTN